MFISKLRHSATAGVTAGAIVAAALAAGPARAATAPGGPADATGTPLAAAASAARAPAGAPVLPDGHGPSAAQQQAMDAASAQATATGKPVVVASLTTPTWQVSAQPGGGFSLADNPSPVRAQERGGWVPVDTGLRRDADGSYTAAATAYATVTFSGGGTAPLAVTTTPSGASYRISWPTALPAPVVSGSSATYDNVLPGVDLQVSANTAGGFSEVLVVHDAAAAANPALAKITLAAQGSGGGDPATGTLVTAGDGLALQASRALMWDSNTTPLASAKAGAAAKGAPAASGTASPAQLAAADPSSADAPGLAAHTAALGLGFGAHSLTLSPDRGLLAAKSTAWPVYIDPTFSWHPASGGTPAYDEVKQDAPCNSVSDYDNKSSSADYGELGVGYLPEAYSPTCEGDERAYYQWKLPSVIDGGTINTSTVNVTEVWQASFACTLNRTINLHTTGGIGSGTDWNNKPGNATGSGAFNGSTTIGAAYSDGCTTDGDAYAGFNVKTPIQTAAKDNWTQITFALTDDAAESAKTITDFSRFSYNPTLDIEFGHAPPAPTASQLSASSGASDVAACDTTSPYPYIGKSIASNPIALKAAAIQSKDGDELQATFKYWLTSTPSTTYTGLSANNLASGAPASYSLPSTFTSALADGNNVAWQVETSNGEWSSGWSPTCTFTAEPTAPDAPSIAANATYPAGVTGADAGTSAKFQISGNTGGAAAVKFYYLLDKAPVTSGTPASETATASANAASVTVTPDAPGPHTLYVDGVDAAGDVSSTASYGFIAAEHAGTTCTTLAACFNNTSISPNATPTEGNADGNGNSFSATDLTNAGWTSGGEVTIDGAPLTLPAFGSGQADNVIAANQTVDCTSTATLACAVPSTGASSLMFLTTGTHSDFTDPGNIAGDTTAPYVPGGDAIAGAYCFTGSDPDGYCPSEGTITYTNGSQQSYFLTVPDWVNGPASLAAAVFPHRNTATTQQTMTTKMYPFSVPLSPGLTIASITLPDDSSLDGATNGLHVYAIGTRDTTSGTVKAGGSTVNPPAGDSWTGAWASDTEGSYNFQSGNFDNQSFRVLVQPSVTGSTVRVKLDDSLGVSPIDIGHATVATTTGNDITPTAASGTTVKLTFNGSQSTVIPEGGMVFSDPLSFNVTAGQWLAVSFLITNSIPDLVQHSFATDSYEYVAPPNSGDHTTDTAATEYVASGSDNGSFTDLVTGLDVQSAGVPTQVVLGDNVIDGFQPNTAPLSPNNGNAIRLSDDLAAASATTPDPYGTVNAGIESNQVTVDNPETLSGAGAVGGPSVLSRIDRDVLDEPGIGTVIIDEGLEDALTGQSELNLENGYDDLLTDLSYTQTSAGGATFVNTVDIGLTPCATYAGDGDTGTGTNANDPCSSAVDTVRTDVNYFLDNGSDLALGPWTPSTFYYVDPDAAVGVLNTSLNEEELGPLAQVALSRNNTPTDPINLTNAGTGALANAILAAQDTWTLNDGAGNTSAADYALNNYSNAYLTTTDPNAGNNTLALNGTYTWPTATVGSQTGSTVLGLDGSTGYGVTSGQVLNTAGSFSVSAWADLSSLPTGDATIAAQSGTEASGFYLQYNPSWGGWCLNFMASDTAGAGGATGVACTTTAPKVNTWYHLVGTYSAATHTTRIYVNGALAATGTGLTAWSATGPLTIGAGQYDATIGDFFPGDISDVQAWSYALSAPQISALYDQIQ
jgi:Concanavalin A-like lectin/glucanases superfamily